MKRFSFIAIFFYLCTFTQPVQVHAAIPLAVYSAAAIGAALAPVVVAGFQKTSVALNKNGSYAFDGSVLTAPLIAYNKYASATGEILLGYLTQAPVAIADLYNRGVIAANSVLNTVLTTLWPANPAPAVGQTFQCPSVKNGYGTNNVCTIASQSFSNVWSGGWGAYEYAYADYSKGLTVVGTCTGGLQYSYPTAQGVIYRTGYYWGYYSDVFCVKTTTATPDQIGPPAAPISAANAKTLSSALADAAKNNNDVRNALDSVLAAHPSAVTSPSGITQADVERYAKDAAEKALADYAATTAANAAANPTDLAAQNAAAQAAADLAKAQADDIAEQAKEETFDAIDSSAFGEDYNPGEFDIPARFTTFLHNVKSSGLFSFSSSFFNSLPSGGSPTLTIEGGRTFGTHTFDFSQALGGGLAILKSVLLACFGFLSIRAVIMKR